MSARRRLRQRAALHCYYPPGDYRTGKYVHLVSMWTRRTLCHRGGALPATSLSKPLCPTCSAKWTDLADEVSSW